MNERFKNLVISHAEVIGNVTHTITHDFSMSVTCVYCEPLIKKNIFNVKVKSLVEKVSGESKSR